MGAEEAVNYGLVAQVITQRQRSARPVAAAVALVAGAVVYQVYVRSFCDGNGDGQGDFAGLIAKLDYIQSLGVDAIWLSPIHPSPNRDWGYDVSDYDGVQPDYGTLEDFQALLDAAHARGLKVVLDEVLAHTSDEHPWFADSRDGDAAKTDWYVWADPQGRRHGAQQLAVGVRRPGLGLPAGAAAILPPQVPAPAAQAELEERATRARRRWRCWTCGWSAASTAFAWMSPTPFCTTPR